MRETFWLECAVLEVAEAVLPRLLQREQGWDSLVTEDAAGGKIERLYRPFNDYDLFLIRLTRSPETDAVFCVGPPEGAMVGRIIEGRMSIGVCKPKKSKRMPYLHLASCSLGPPSWYAYRSGSRLSWRLDSPLSLHVLVSRKSVLMDPNPATPETVAKILSSFREYYPDPAGREAEADALGYGHRD